MTRSTLQLILAVALAAAPSTALADILQEARCTSDNLDPTEAVQRLEWARKCGLLTNSSGPNNWFPSTKAFESSGGTFVGAKEYAEINHNRAYSGNSNGFNVNYYYSSNRYETTPVYTVFQETSGPTTGYWKWSHTTPRGFPRYPSFDTRVDGLGTPLLPLPSVPNDCNLYVRDAATGVLTPWTGDFFVIAYCDSGCYAPDQSLRFRDGDVNIVDAMKAQRDDVVTLSPDATLDHLITQTSSVYSYTTEIRDAEHIIYKLTTASGGSLRVTNEHPVLTSGGRLVQAEKLREGDKLLKANGTPDPITKVEKGTHFGKVYNIKPMSREHVANILIAQGYLVGSGRFQSEDVEYMNRILLFRAVPDEVMPR